MPRNYTDNPATLVEQVFEQIHQNQMQDLPFINPHLKVATSGFDLYEGDWLGVLITPWTLSILLIPGPGREWQSFHVGDKLGIRLPAGDYTFMVGEHEELGDYLSCSVQSPVQDILSQDEALRVAADIRKLITAIPTRDISDSARRNLFSKLVKGQPALESGE